MKLVDWLFVMGYLLILGYFLANLYLSVVLKAAAMDDSVWLCSVIIFSPLLISLWIQGGPEGLRSLTNPKAIIVDRWPSLMQTSIPKVLDYPLHSFQYSWFVSLPVSLKPFLDFILWNREFTSGLVRFLYSDGWRASISGLMSATRAASKY